MLARMLRCEMITPLGSAVAPDVKMISAVSSRATVARGARAVACQSNSDNGHTGVGPAWLWSTSSPVSTRRAFTMPRHTPQKFGRRAVVDRHGDDPLEPAPPEGGDPFGPVLGPEHHRVTFGQTSGGEPRAKGPGRAAHVGIGKGPLAKAVVVRQKRPAQGGQVIEEVEQRVSSHALTYDTGSGLRDLRTADFRLQASGRNSRDL